MGAHGAKVDVPGRTTKHDHRLSAEEHDHGLSCERIAAAAATLLALADCYRDVPAPQVSPTARRRLSQAAAHMEQACDPT